MSEHLFSDTEGAILAAEGIEAAIAESEKEEPGLLDEAYEIAEELGRTGAVVTIDDVQAALYQATGSMMGKEAGAVFRDRKTWACVGITHSRRITNHAHRVGQWRLRHFDTASH